MTTMDNNLIQQYKNMIGITTISSISKNTLFNDSLTINSSLYVSNTSILNNIICNSTLNISGKTVFTNDYVTPNIIVSGNSIINNLNINGYININNLNTNSLVVSDVLTLPALTLCNTLNVSNSTALNDTLFINYISSSTSIHFDSDNIIIGTTNSQIKIKGTDNYIKVTELKINDKLISLNSLNNNPADVGLLSGLELLGISGTGYLRINDTGYRFDIKAPLDKSSNTILTLDTNNNLTVSGTTLFINDVTTLSNIAISGNSVFNNLLLKKNLYVNNQVFNDTVTILSNLNINNNCTFNNTNFNNDLIINCNNIHNNINLYAPSNNNNILLKSTTIGSNLYVSGYSILNDLNITNLNISGNSIFNNFNFSNICISGKSLFNNVTINSLSGTDLILNNTTMNSNIIISGISILNNNCTIKSKLNVFGNININGIKHYDDNNQAVEAGIPFFGLYRTGGILKIRLDDIPPIITLYGTSITSYYGNNIIEPGGLSIDNMDGNIPIYLSGIMTGNTNLLSTPILLNTTNITILNTNTILGGDYTATYTATDSIGNIGYNYRLYNILDLWTLYPYNSTNISYLSPTNSPAIFNSSGMTAESSSKMFVSSNIVSTFPQNWGVVIKYFPPQNSTSIVLVFDVNFTYMWSGYGYLGINFDWNNYEFGEISFNITARTDTTLMRSGAYMSIGYNSSTKYFRVQIVSLAGNIIFDANRIHTFTGAYPLSINVNGPSMFYSKGILVSKIGFLNYSSYSNVL